MIDAMLHKITGDLPLRYIDDDDGKRYLERYYVGTAFGWRFYLHRFVGPDPDRGLHDHPWRLAVSVRLSGYYYELTRQGRRKQRRVGIITGDTFHRIERLATPAVWTLFGHTVGDVKTWGFLQPIGGKMHSEGSAVFDPFVYPGGVKPAQWWTTATTRNQRAAR